MYTENYSKLPSPWLQGEGILKTLLMLPKHLQYLVLYIVVFFSHFALPFISFLLRGACISYCTCHMYGLVCIAFIVIHLCDVCAHIAYLPSVRALTHEMSWLSTRKAWSPWCNLQWDSSLHSKRQLLALCPHQYFFSMGHPCHCRPWAGSICAHVHHVVMAAKLLDCGI